MTTITENNDVVTLINVFTVEQAKQQQLVDTLVRATEEKMRYVPGFISSNIHKSEDGVRVVNYAQWASRADFEAMLRDPEATRHRQELAMIATSSDAHLHTVAKIIPAPSGEPARAPS